MRRFCLHLAIAAVACPAALASAQTTTPSLADLGDFEDAVRASRDDLVRAARADAVDRLFLAVKAEALAPGLTVGGMLGQLNDGAARRVRQALEDAPQIGGPRFAAPGTAQVQLQAGGELVAAALRRELARDGAADRLPESVSFAHIERTLRRWTGRNFVALGRSVTPEMALGALPRDGAGTNSRIEPLDPETGWPAVPDEARQRAFVEARREVMERLMTAARPVPLASESDDPESSQEVPAGTLGDLFDLGRVGEQSRRYLAARPVTRIAFADERQIRVSLSLDPADWVARLRGDLEEIPNAPALDDRQWAEVITRLAAALPEEVTGTAVAEAPGDGSPRVADPEANTLVAALRPLVDPTDAAAVVPQWSRQLIAATGQAGYAIEADEPDWQQSRKRLIAARAAERDARAALVEALRALPLGEQSTLGAVADTHTPTSLLLAAAAESATVKGSAYDDASGRVEVSLTADGRALWQQLISLGGN